MYVFSHWLNRFYATFGIVTRTEDHAIAIYLLSDPEDRVFRTDKKMFWKKYLQEEELEKYPEIVKLFDSDSEAIILVKRALSNDRALRPVFMQILPEEKTGKIEILNKKLASEKIKEEKTLTDYILENKGIFLCGKPKAANDILTRGGKIVVAITDRHNDSAQYSVANLRQCYIPLPDGRLLAFKSSGLFHDRFLSPIIRIQ